MSDVVYMTKERADEIQDELHILKTRGRKEIAGKIADARSHGDLSENAEYDAAKEEQGLHELKINGLEMQLAKAQIISPDEMPEGKIFILSKVKLKHKGTGVILDYMMVSPEEADFEKKKISVDSPIGKALLGKEEGEIASFTVPAGKQEYEILEISK
jgi:transcription elongation factor GreA